MLEAIPAPREETKETAPQILSLSIPTDKIRDVIGSGGKVIRGRDLATFRRDRLGFIFPLLA